VKKERITPTILESPDIVAFLSLTRNIQPRPFIRQSDRRVCFEFQEDVSDSIAEFYSNVPVPISDFCKNLKNIRSMIFNMKGMGNHAHQ
jgi:hypothetical protein